jgi:hypothetical protein
MDKCPSSKHNNDSLSYETMTGCLTPVPDEDISLDIRRTVDHCFTLGG